MKDKLYKMSSSICFLHNLVPRVLKLFSQWMVASRDSEELEFCLKFLTGCFVTARIVLPQKFCGNKIPVPRVSPGDQPQAKEPKDSGKEITSYM